LIVLIRESKSGNQNNHPGYREFLVDSPSDIADLPTDPGEIMWGAYAAVISTGEVYVLNSSHAWVRFGG